VKVGLGALLGGGEESELGDAEDFTVDVLHVLFPLRIFVSLVLVLHRAGNNKDAEMVEERQGHMACDKGH
jgi:hypothetical protein